ncbi:MarR family winged helix-turn-helix transcriptional regulator [Carboxylicivirga sp. N1Y90]|uniref:MarR family winged helix-turn-helix transcriptional regulator n=1 Tax=Carboxylicivirga fragile TaxID=3417571 RepID=UPI003D34E7A3|nr:MarR family transcriptional regulator [Marinilabiliaceae bacterium N1Y90]
MGDITHIHALAYFNLLKTSGWIESRVKEALKPFGITHAQLNVLHILSENDPEPVSANDLKERILVSSPDVTRLLDRLVKKELVHRETCPNNRRKMDISLTGNGKKIFGSTQKAMKDALGDFFKDKLTVEEAKELRKIMHKIRE